MNFHVLAPLPYLIGMCSKFGVGGKKKPARKSESTSKPSD